MRPVRVKYLGLLPITRRTYLVLQFIGLLICMAMMVVGLSVMLRMGVYFPHVPAADVQDDFVYQALLSLFWLGLLIVVLKGLETIVMLRKFARAAAERKARLAAIEAIEPVPAPPNSTAVRSHAERGNEGTNQRPNTNIQP
jgi:TRAP-type C4-dicarboxylate transport system permease small subunit